MFNSSMLAYLRVICDPMYIGMGHVYIRVVYTLAVETPRTICGSFSGGVHPPPLFPLQKFFLRKRGKMRFQRIPATALRLSPAGDAAGVASLKGCDATGQEDYWKYGELGV